MENNIFESNSISKVYMKLALPVVFGMLVSIVYNIADTFFIAQTGNMNLVAGVALGSPIFMVLMAFGNILGQGGSSLLSRLIGKKDVENVKSVSSFCFWAAAAIGVITSVIMVAFQGPILRILGATTETYEYAWGYYIVLAFGAPISVLTFIHNNLIRTEGLATESMIGSIGGSIVNIILDPIFISVFGMGAFGAALATILGQVFSVVFYLCVVFKKSQYISVDPKFIRISFDHMKQIIGIGIPAALSNIMSSICLIMTNQYLLPYGSDKIGCMGIANKLAMMGMLVITGFAFGGSPVIGYFYGSRNTEKLKQLFSFCYKFILSIGFGFAIVLYVLAPVLLKAFTTDPAMISQATIMFRLQVVCLPFLSVVLMSQIFCQSFGNMIGSFVLSLSRQGFVFIIAMVIASALLGYNGVISCQLIADIASTFISLFVIKTIVLPNVNLTK